MPAESCGMPTEGSAEGSTESSAEMARPEGFEPPTYGFEARRSIQLSYGRSITQFTTE